MIKLDVEEFVKGLDLEQLRALAALVQEEIGRQQGNVAGFVLNEAELTHIRAGHPIQAIKSVRDRTGLGLDVCRNLVAAWQSGDR